LKRNGIKYKVVDHKLNLLQLYPKLLAGEISTEELNWLAAYFDNGDQQELITMIRAELDLPNDFVQPVLNEAQVLNVVYQNLEKHLGLNTTKKDFSKPFIVRLWFKIGIAAAVISIMIGVSLFYFKDKNGIAVKDIVAANDIAPAKQGATLTLANGKQIRLSDVSNEELEKEAGLKVSKTKSGQLVYTVSSLSPAGAKDGYHTLTTKKGEQYSVVLPDGSQVWLNAESSVRYPTSFAKQYKRQVTLTGEGYFEIAKAYNSSSLRSSASSLRSTSSLGSLSSLVGSVSSLRGGTPKQSPGNRIPFLVETKGQQVEVLGTHFNINAYNDEPVIVTTLMEGSVNVTTGNLKQLLKPGEQAENNGRFLTVSPANVEKAIDWKNGEFYINQIDFKIAMRKIARWYDVDVIYNSSVPDDMQIGGWVSRSEKLSAVLESIELACKVHFRLDGRKIYVSK